MISVKQVSIWWCPLIVAMLIPRKIVHIITRRSKNVASNNIVGGYINNCIPW